MDARPFVWHGVGSVMMGEFLRISIYKRYCSEIADGRGTNLQILSVVKE